MIPKAPRPSLVDIHDVPPPPSAVVEAAHELERELVRGFESALARDDDRPTLVP